MFIVIVGTQFHPHHVGMHLEQVGMPGVKVLTIVDMC